MTFLANGSSLNIVKLASNAFETRPGAIDKGHTRAALSRPSW